MQKHPELTLARIQAFATERGLAGKLYTKRAPVKLSVFHAPDRIRYEEAMQGDYQPAQIGQHFGPFWSTHWFRVEIEVPTAWAGQEVHFLWDSGSEAEVWQDGQPMQGLAGSGVWGSPGPLRARVYPHPQSEGGRNAHPVCGNGCQSPVWLEGFGYDSEMGTVGLLRQAEIALFDRDAWDLLWDFKVIADMAPICPCNTPRGGQALFAANEMVNLIDLDDREHLETGAQDCRGVFQPSTTAMDS